MPGDGKGRSISKQYVSKRLVFETEVHLNLRVYLSTLLCEPRRSDPKLNLKMASLI
jgi:hypothetical protein